MECEVYTRCAGVGNNDDQVAGSDSRKAPRTDRSCAAFTPQRVGEPRITGSSPWRGPSDPPTGTVRDRRSDVRNGRLAGGRVFSCGPMVNRSKRRGRTRTVMLQASCNRAGGASARCGNGLKSCEKRSDPGPIRTGDRRFRRATSAPRELPFGGRTRAHRASRSRDG